MDIKAIGEDCYRKNATQLTLQECVEAYQAGWDHLYGDRLPADVYAESCGIAAANLAMLRIPSYYTTAWDDIRHHITALAETELRAAGLWHTGVA